MEKLGDELVTCHLQRNTNYKNKIEILCDESHKSRADVIMKRDNV